MFGKLMSVSDAVMRAYYPLVGGVAAVEVAAIEAGLQDGRVHPMEAKKRLASAVVARFHGTPAARAAEEAFARQFQAREVPTDVPRVPLPAGVEHRLFEVVLRADLAASASEAKRLIQQGGIRLDERKVEDPYATLVVRPGEQVLVQKGRREFRRLEGVPGEGGR
jgi:tyrosyl-tRNA synthetase